MGIKSNFSAFMRGQCGDDIFEKVSLKEFAYKRIAIDISLYMHKFKSIKGEFWMQMFVELVACIRENNIHCVFIFDGKSPPEKIKEQSSRRKDKSKMKDRLCRLEEAMVAYHATGKISECIVELYNKKRTKDPPPRRLLSNVQQIDMNWVEYKIQHIKNQMYEVSAADFVKVRKLFDIMSVPYYTAPLEAEKLCSELAIKGQVDAVLSEDTDVLAYGCPVFLSKIDISKQTIVKVVHNELLQSLELSSPEFLDLCIMCGTDYNPNIPRIGSKTSYKYLCQFRNIESLQEALPTIDTSILNYTRVREMFTTFEEHVVPDIIPYCGYPDFKELAVFMRIHNCRTSLYTLKHCFTSNNDIVFEQ